MLRRVLFAAVLGSACGSPEPPPPPAGAEPKPVDAASKPDSDRLVASSVKPAPARANTESPGAIPRGGGAEPPSVVDVAAPPPEEIESTRTRGHTRSNTAVRDVDDDDRSKDPPSHSVVKLTKAERARLAAAVVANCPSDAPRKVTLSGEVASGRARLSKVTSATPGSTSPALEACIRKALRRVVLPPFKKAKIDGLEITLRQPEAEPDAGATP